MKPGLAFLLLAVCTPAAAAPAPSLSGSVEQQVQALAPGARRVGAFIEGSASRAFTSELKAGMCYFVSARAADARRISISLAEPDGFRVAESRPGGVTAMLAYCPPFSGSFRTQIKLEGRGVYAVGIFERSMSAPPPPLVGAPSPPPPVVAAPAPTVMNVTVTHAAPPPQECRMGSDGMNVCGYNCMLGSSGRYYCSSYPDGRCALNSDGTYTCPGRPMYRDAIIVPVGGGSSQSQKGQRNDPCSNNLDCGFGLFCREDSDGYKMCM